MESKGRLLAGLLLVAALPKLRPTALHDACMADEARCWHLVIADVGPTIEVSHVLEGGSRTEALS
ncbi:hypothetical protein X759_24290 [Mesorhizobium sp. LSHC420B00]|nr:hypothetical protein X759_24290 [Mesorhizobium sp. LSHC420B00]